MPFINDMLDSHVKKNSAEVTDLRYQSSAADTTIYAKRQHIPSRFLFDPQQVMQKLRARIVGQEHVLARIESMLKVLKADISDPEKPLYIALFVGPTGVGKTELVRVLTEALHGKADACCRIDMNTLAQDHYAAALVGAPPGYVGSKEGNSLLGVDKIQGSYSRPGIVLFDEIEKAGVDVVRALLNMMDTGQLRITSGSRTVDFRNTLVFMTSNLGAKELLRYEQQFSSGWYQYLPSFLLPTSERRRVSGKRLVDKAMQRAFDPEFINRFDDVLLFNRIESEWLIALVTIETQRYNERLAQKKWKLVMEKSAARFVVQTYAAEFGARSIRRGFKQCIEPAIADFLLRAEYCPENTALRLIDVREHKGRIITQEIFL